ncbi:MULTISPECIES: glutathione peroxidase [unclassified Prochlorococcus]|uniref:glutathione peroxidase n=1 Tax=unclassified Prochlorococcus TaxID=2627481 RepID=UPI000533842B|nr:MULTISPECIES: glutathione peroxidase [unclassified Prochlorococcus]KGG15541.1 Glutathione peroxidase [Prochlorococcus sp. MIT 0602]KGG17821.1 Glutathione peroxidase [Prochlorococcus sp. MIT 0603]
MLVNVKTTEVQTSSGKKKKLGDYSGQVLLIVNVASRCGNTPQYAGLQELHDKYKEQGFAVLGFPCNDFGGQEPGSLDEIQKFCSVNFGVTFEIFNKVHAKGATTEPYTTLNKSEPMGDVAWNFEKFLVDKEGNVIARFEPSVQPSSEDLIAAIEVALAS